MCHSVTITLCYTVICELLHEKSRWNLGNLMKLSLCRFPKFCCRLFRVNSRWCTPQFTQTFPSIFLCLWFILMRSRASGCNPFLERARESNFSVSHFPFPQNRRVGVSLVLPDIQVLYWNQLKIRNATSIHKNSRIINSVRSIPSIFYWVLQSNFTDFATGENRIYIYIFI